MASDLVTQASSLLKTQSLGRELKWYDSIASTNSEALKHAKMGASEGLVIGTEHQTAGRGRHGRPWTGTTGHNLLFSVILWPRLAPKATSLIPLAAGIAVAEAIELETTLSPLLKWPNDVLINNKKVCGILVEGHVQLQHKEHACVVGIGLNVNQTEFSDDLVQSASSLFLLSGQQIPRAPLLAKILLHLEQRYQSLLQGEIETVRPTFEQRMVHMNEHVLIHSMHNTSSFEGVIRGIAQDGALRLETDSGIQHVHAGEVSLSSTQNDSNRTL